MTNFDPQEAERLAEERERLEEQIKDLVPRLNTRLAEAEKTIREERGYVRTLLHQADEAMERLTAAEKVVEAARYALRAWQAMPDALLTDRDPRYNWWMQTHAERQALAQALQEYDGKGERV